MTRSKLALGIGVVLTVGTGCRAPENETRVTVVQQALEDTLEQENEARVIINLVRPRDGLRELERRAEMRGAGLRVKHRAGAGLRVIHEFAHVPAIAGMISREALEAIRDLDEVRYVQLDEMGGGSLSEAVPSTGATRVQASLGLRGKGIRVAVLDSGASTSHPAIADSLVAQHCFTSGSCPPNDTDEGSSAEDDQDHGSNVTGIITSNGTGGLSVGYAPDSEIIAVKVLDRAGRGWVSDWVSGLEWVYDNLPSNQVRLINMSLDTDSLYGSRGECDLAQPAFVSIAADLNASGVTIFASSGNAGSTDAMSAPACNTGFIAVGATYDAQLGKQPSNAASYQALFGSPPWPNCSDSTTSTTTVTCFTNTGGTRLDLLAPGAILTSAGNGTTNTNYRGTSQASPAAAGIAALMLECNPGLTPARIAEVLKATGQSVTDPRTSRSYPLIRAEAAMAEACQGSSGSGGAAATGGNSASGGTTAAQSGGQPSTAGTTYASGGTRFIGSSTGGQSSLASGGTRLIGSNTGGQSILVSGGQGSASGGLGSSGGTASAASRSIVTTTRAVVGGTTSSGGATNDTGATSDPPNADTDRSDVTASCSCRTPTKRAGGYQLAYVALSLLVVSGRRKRRAVRSMKSVGSRQSTRTRDPAPSGCS